MYNAYLTSDYTTQVEELDTSYGTAQDWADLHEYEEQEMLNELKVYYTKVSQSYDHGISMAHYQVSIDWGLTNAMDALSLIFNKNKQLQPNDVILIDDEDANRIVRGAKPEHYQFLRTVRAYVLDGQGGMLPFYLWVAINHTN